jgi:hypothetical protein
MATLAAAGLPMLQRDNRGSIVAAHALALRLGIGIDFRTPEELGARLREECDTPTVRARVTDVREAFAWDTHADRLIEFFRRVIARDTARTWRSRRTSIGAGAAPARNLQARSALTGE